MMALIFGGAVGGAVTTTSASAAAATDNITNSETAKADAGLKVLYQNGNTDPHGSSVIPRLIVKNEGGAGSEPVPAQSALLVLQCG